MIDVGPFREVVGSSTVILRGQFDGATLAAIAGALAVNRTSVQIQQIEAPRVATIADLITYAAYQTGVSAARIIGEGRSRPDVRARTAVTWAARELLGRPYAVIGRALGDRDHSTIICAVKRAARLIEGDPGFQLLAKRLTAFVAERNGA